MKHFIGLQLIILFLFISCKKEETTATNTNSAESVFSDSFSGPIDTSKVAVNSAIPLESTTANLNTSPSPNMTSIPANSSSTVTAKGMNPAHGQSGHRCDIAVGAPLNSPPTKAPIATKPLQPMQSAAQPTTVPNSPMNFNTDGNSTINTTTTPSTPVVTAPGMNPPHGQEGHVCSVAVGAPLPKP